MNGDNHRDHEHTIQKHTDPNQDTTTINKVTYPNQLGVP